MKRFVSNPLPRLTALVLGIWAVETISVRKAHAACGDYVIVGKPQSSNSRPHPTSPGTSRPCPQSCPQQNSRPDGLPCQGPTCSEGKPPLTAVPVVLPERGQDNWAWLGGLHLVSEGRSVPWVAISENLSLSHLAVPVYHPPRR